LQGLGARGLEEEKRITSLRVYVVRGGGADYHDQGSGHWIVGKISTPMSVYPEYRETRTSWGINVLGSFIVELESSDGSVGVGVSVGGYPAAWIVKNHLSRFVIGKRVGEINRAWDQMYRATLYYGRKGIAMHAISAVDLAMWDLLGMVRGLPVCDLIGGPVKDEIMFYATGPRPDLAKKMGFIGGKMPLVYSPSEGLEGLRRNVEAFAEMRRAVGDEFLLMYDCWMSLDLPYASRLLNELKRYNIYWIEEPFPPDDYWSYGELARQAPPALVTGGEHEYGLQGFRLLLEIGRVNVVQPDVTWVGGLTPMIKIAALAEAYGAWVIPHGSSVYSYHFVASSTVSPFAEFIMMHPQASEVIPMFHPLFEDEPVPSNGALRIPRKPGFGVRINRSLRLEEVTK